MQQVFDKFNFTIIIKSRDVEVSSEYWKEQCCKLYSSICTNIPDGWIEPLKSECSEGEKAELSTVFSTLVVFGITGKVFAEIILKAMKTWLEHIPTAEIELKCPDGSTFEISKLPLTKLSEFFEENPQLSVCEGLSHFVNSNQ
jgi:hypothetical protein